MVGIDFDARRRNVASHSTRLKAHRTLAIEVRSSADDHVVSTDIPAEKVALLSRKATASRDLTLDEVREVTNIIRRIAAILLLTVGLDANYKTVIEQTVDWKK